MSRDALAVVVLFAVFHQVSWWSICSLDLSYWFCPLVFPEMVTSSSLLLSSLFFFFASRWLFRCPSPVLLLRISSRTADFDFYALSHLFHGVFPKSLFFPSPFLLVWVRHSHRSQDQQSAPPLLDPDHWLVSLSFTPSFLSVSQNQTVMASPAVVVMTFMHPWVPHFMDACEHSFTRMAAAVIQMAAITTTARTVLAATMFPVEQATTKARIV